MLTGASMAIFEWLCLSGFCLLTKILINFTDFVAVMLLIKVSMQFLKPIDIVIVAAHFHFAICPLSLQ